MPPRRCRARSSFEIISDGVSDGLATAAELQ
jgi:hypothetical protein